MPDSDTTPTPDLIKHEWWVYSTAITEGWLMLHCKLTGATGTVRDPSKEEWAAAFHAPSNPYLWTDEARIVVDPRCESEPQQCRFCGCTDDDCSQCIERTGEPCSWVARELCSACLTTARKITYDMAQHVLFDFGRIKEEPPTLEAYPLEWMVNAEHVLKFFDAQQEPDPGTKKVVTHKVVAERLAAALFTMTAHKDALPADNGEVAQILLCRDQRHQLILVRVPEEKMIITLPEFTKLQAKRLHIP